MGFGQHSKQGAMVGGYFAYRDGKRQAMNNASGSTQTIDLLTRWSVKDPNYEMPAIGIADFWFGAVGLAETLQPGTADKLRNTFFMPHHEITDEDNGYQVVHFSALTPRHVVGIRDDGSEQSFGFQRSPFTVPNRDHFNDYRIEDPEGDWIELDDVVGELEGGTARFSNPDFESGIEGWQYRGSRNYRIMDNGGVSGKGVRVRSSSTGESTLTQAVSLPISLVDSQYKVSGFIKPMKVTESEAFIRAYWTAEKTSQLPIGEVTTSAVIGAGEDGQLVSVYTKKPEGAAYLQIEYVVSGNPETIESFMFDNTSLQLSGTLEELANGDFENGENDWTMNTGMASVKPVDALDKDGQAYQTNALVFELQGSNLTQSVATDIDVVGDPVGTRYIFKFDVLENMLKDKEELGKKPATDFDIDVEITSVGGKKVVRPYVATIETNSKDEIAFVMRKRPDEESFKVIFNARQRRTNIGLETVAIDNFRVYKQRLLP